MGATNRTTYYNLSQFIGTDKPAWLQDYNGDMLKIDIAINAAKLAADAAALAASAAQNTADGAVSSLTTLSSTVAAHTTAITNLSGAVNTINSLIGNGTPTTTDQTIIGAINEINGHVKSTDISDDVTVNSAYLHAKEAKRSGDVVSITIQVTNVDTTTPVTVGSVEDYLKPDIVKVASTVYGDYPVFGLLKENGEIEIRSEVNGIVGGAITFNYII